MSDDKEFILVSSREQVSLKEIPPPIISIAPPLASEVIEVKLVRGPPGDSWEPKTVTQTTPTLEWTIAHNLGYFPNVTIFDQMGNAVDCTVTNVSVNVLRLDFNAPFMGTCRLI